MNTTSPSLRSPSGWIAAGILLLLAGSALAGGTVGVAGWTLAGNRVVVEVVNAGDQPATASVSLHLSTGRGPVVLTAPVFVAPGGITRLEFPLPNNPAPPTILGAVVDDGSPF